MADQNITALPKKTSSQLAATDYLLGIDSAEGYQMLIQDLGDYIIQHATSSLAGSSQTLASAISALNSNFESNKRYFVTSDARFLKVSLNNVTDGQEFILMNTRGDLLQLFVQSGSVSYTKYNVAHSGIYEISISGKDVYIAIKFGSEYGVQGWAIYGADKFVYTLTRVASVPSGATSAAVNTSQIDALNNSNAGYRVRGIVEENKASATVSFPEYTTVALIIVGRSNTYSAVYLYVYGYTPMEIFATANKPTVSLSADYKTITFSGLNAVAGGKTIMVISSAQKPTIAS